MFKFRSSLVNQLLNHVKINPEWNCVEDIEQLNEVISTSDKRPLTSSRRHSSSALLANVKRKQVQSMLLRLKKANLEVLLNAVQSGTPGDCVFIPACNSSANAGSSSQPPPHILLSQVFRWPDLQFEWELKRLDFYCHALHHFDQQQKSSDFCQPKLYECCNPYHWTRTLQSPTTYKSNASVLEVIPDLDRQQEDHPRCETENRVGNQLPSSESSASSTISRPPYPKRPKRRTSSTGNQSGSPLIQPQWCQLAYWEECNRVGRLVPVSSSHIEVFSLLPKPKGRHESSSGGLCLATLFKQNKSPSESTAKTREKIGQGILLSQVENGVWVYNRTSNPIFVNSPTLEPSPNLSASSTNNPSSSINENNQDNFTVIRVSPGYSIQVFDYQKSDYYERIRQPLGMPFDPYSIRISFAKGWGTKYSRQVVTNCPCWLEILLTVHR